MVKLKNGTYVKYDTVKCDRYSFEGTAEEVKVYIDSVVEFAKNKGMIGEGRFDLSVRNGYYDDDYELVIEYDFTRSETAEEKAAREKEDADRKADADAKRKAAAEKKKMEKDPEYEEFVRLSKKFKL